MKQHIILAAMLASGGFAGGIRSSHDEYEPHSFPLKPVNEAGKRIQEEARQKQREKEARRVARMDKRSKV